MQVTMRTIWNPIFCVVLSGIVYMPLYGSTEPSASCSFAGKTIANGVAIIAYKEQAVPYGSACASETRACIQGSLSGTYQHESCLVGLGPWHRQYSISGMFGNSSIVIKASPSFGGAIYSVTWKGREFVDAHDHGRELQSAISFDGHGECYNPTEAGSAADGADRTSTSILLSADASENVLKTESMMAFWLAPDRSKNCWSGVSKAVNTTKVSDIKFRKVVTIGAFGIPNAIEHKVTFKIPQSHNTALIEALTGYMPSSFSNFWAYDPSTRTLSDLSDGPGEQEYPVILATPDGSYAMGTYSPDRSFTQGYVSGGYTGDARVPRYGRFKFGPPNNIVKWNCVFREKGVLAYREYTYRCYVVVGTLIDVKRGIDRLHTRFAPVQP